MATTVKVSLVMRGVGPGQGDKRPDVVRDLGEVDAKQLARLKDRYIVGDASKKDHGVPGKPGETPAYLLIEGGSK